MIRKNINLPFENKTGETYGSPFCVVKNCVLQRSGLCAVMKLHKIHTISRDNYLYESLYSTFIFPTIFISKPSLCVQRQCVPFRWIWVLCEIEPRFQLNLWCCVLWALNSLEMVTVLWKMPHYSCVLWNGRRLMIESVPTDYMINWGILS